MISLTRPLPGGSCWRVRSRRMCDVVPVHVACHMAHVAGHACMCAGAGAQGGSAVHERLPRNRTPFSVKVMQLTKLARGR